MKPAAQRLVGILTGMALIIASLVVYSSLLMPKYREVQNLRGERFALTGLLAEEQESVDAVQRLIRQYSSISDLRDSLAVTLPSQEETASIVNQFQGIASSNGILMDSLSIRPLAIAPRVNDLVVEPLGILRVNMKLVGDYGSLKAYLSALETNVRIMDVKSIRVENAGRNSGPYDYQVEVDTYYQL
ncbi:MAG: type 4a pilus biogenesis protein PilO [bacterium]|nr:type 4a pilus biogenesis protein PilO [bacterium]